MDKAKNDLFSFRLLLFAGLFLMTPIFALVDVLPDAIGFLLFVFFLSRLSDLNDEIAASRRLFLDLFVLGLLREGLNLLVRSASKWENAFEVPTLLLLLSFVWGLLQAILLIPAFKHLYRGVSALAETCGADALWATRRNLTVCERAERKTTVLVLLHSVFMVLPEFGALGLKQGQTTSEGLYAYVNTYRVLAGIVLLILLILWWILWIGFCRILLREKDFAARLKSARAEDISGHPGRAERRSLYLGLCLAGFSMLVFLPIRIADYSIFPGVLCGFLALIGFMRLRIPKKWVATLPLIAVGSARIVLHFLYLAEHLPKDALYETDAYYAYLVLRILHGAEFIAAALLLLVLYRSLCCLFEKRLSICYEPGEYSEEASLHATEKLKKSLFSKLRLGLCCFSASGLLSLVDLALRPGFAYFWIPACLCGAAGLFVFWLPTFRDATDDFVTIEE